MKIHRTEIGWLPAIIEEDDRSLKVSWNGLNDDRWTAARTENGTVVDGLMWDGSSQRKDTQTDRQTRRDYDTGGP